MPNVDGGKELEGVWFCLSCYWENDEDELSVILTQKTSEGKE
jgi:Zn-finger protein